MIHDRLKASSLLTDVMPSRQERDARRYWPAALALALVATAAQPLCSHVGEHKQIEKLTERMKRSPHDATLFLRRGDLYRLHGEWVVALKDFERAQELDPSLYSVVLVRGKLFLDAGCPQLAKFCADGYIRLEPRSPQGFLLRAKALAMLHDASGAASDYTCVIDRVSRRRRPPPEIFLSRANVLADAKRYTEAIAGIDEGIARLGSVVTLERRALELEIESGRLDDAMSRVQTLLSVSSRTETWLATIGEIHTLAGRDAEAIAAYRQALRAIDSLSARRKGLAAVALLEERVRRALVRLQTRVDAARESHVISTPSSDSS